MTHAKLEWKCGCFFCSYLDKSGTARLTLVWLFSRVDPGMSFEVGWSVKLSTTDVAVVRFGSWKIRSAWRCNELHSHTSTKIQKRT